VGFLIKALSTLATHIVAVFGDNSGRQRSRVRLPSVHCRISI